ncbi:MAG: MaoC family dehydratase [Ferrimicrobium sp.]
MRYLENFAPGQIYELGRHVVSADEITHFATEWDPQRFHIDPFEAERSPFGGLIASGWHTASIFMRLYATALLVDSACVGSPGVDELRWLAPVRPGDTLSGRASIERVVFSSSRPSRGTVYPRCELRNQEDTVVFTMVIRTLFTRRPGALLDHHGR